MEYRDIRSINVNSHIEKKHGLSYLSWAWAVDQLLMLDSEASWEYGEPKWFGETLMVFCTVTAFGKRRTAQLPVMDFYNRPISLPDAYQVNTAMQRCLAKAISLHGIGLYLYAGEDLPEGEKKEVRQLKELKQERETKLVSANEGTKAAKPNKQEAIKVEAPKGKITPTSGAMDQFAKEEQELLHVISENITHLTETEQLEEATHILGSLTNEEKVAVWSLLDSKTRKTLKDRTKQ
jgi:Protein of unknown function (DUF1071)